MTLSLDYHKLAPLIEPNTLILTPNARTQKAIYSGQLVNLEENKVVASVDVRSFSQWQDELWCELSFYRILPARISNLAIKTWLEKLIEKEPDWTLTNLSGVAAKVLEAYQNLIQWELCLTDVSANESIEIDYFKSWIGKLEEFFTKKNFIADFALLKYIDDDVEQLVVNLPGSILLVGFNQLTPLQQGFFDSLVKRNISIKKYNFQVQPQCTNQIRFSSLKDELAFAAQYAKEYVTEADENAQSIGIVVEGLANNLGLVHQSFSNTFQPEEIKPWVVLCKPHYNVSAGFSLAEQALIQAALFLLNLKTNRLKLEELHFLKNTPFIYWGEQESPVKYFLHQLCVNARKEYSIGFLLKSIESQDNPQQLSKLADRLKFLSNLNGRYALMDEHISHWQQILSCWQWGETHDIINYQSQNKHYSGLNKFEVKAKEAFLKILKESVSLNQIYDPISPADAINFLNQSSQQQTFQIASDRSDVHILGVLEATGLQFDKLIIVGFNSTNWPQRNKINPFLPLSLQREKNMPGSSAEREYEYAKDLSDSLLRSANQIIVTSSDEGSDSVNAASSFFSHLPHCDIDNLVEGSLNEEVPAIDNALNYQWVEDSEIGFSDLETKGGAYLLSDYAKCPFQSLTKYQLKVSTYDVPEIGIEPKVKGTWLHDTMEIIWRELGSQKALLNLMDTELEKLILGSLHEAKQRHLKFLLATTDEEIIELEAVKLSNLIFEWMMIEKDRDEFLVEQLEKEYQLKLDTLSLNFRIDRIDQNLTSQIEIIDYKTGKTEIKNWFSVRPTEAQMPAYVLSMNDRQISRLNYARIKTGEVAQTGLRFKGAITGNGDNNNIDIEERYLDDLKIFPLKGNKISEINELIAQWRQSLNRMANGITRGYMPVSPKDKNLSCLFCDYRSFCRIDEEQPDD